MSPRPAGAAWAALAPRGGLAGEGPAAAAARGGGPCSPARQHARPASPQPPPIQPPTAHLPSPASTPASLRRDTAGQERYLSLAPLYYRGAHAAAIVYDITSAESFAKAKYWIKELQKNAAGSTGGRALPAAGCCECCGGLVLLWALAPG